jgi:hypothetical protein
MTADEKRDLGRRVSPLSYSFSEMKEVGGMFVSVGGMLAFAVVAIWLILAWIVQAIFDVNFGWNHPHGLKVFWTLVALSLAYAAKEVFRVNRSNPEYKNKLLKDIENGVVEIEKHTITAAKVFQEPEHGGLMYFLRTAEDRVYVSFDYESQDLGVAGGDPTSSSFKAKRELKIERTPLSRTVLVETFAGDNLELPDPVELTAHPDNWPESEDFVGVPWAKLESKYCG